MTWDWNQVFRTVVEHSFHLVLRHNLNRNNHPEHITSAPRNLDSRIVDNTRKLTTVCLLYIKGLAERIQKICRPYDIRTVFTSGSTLRRHLFRFKPPTKFYIIKNCVYSIPCSCGKIYKGETGHSLKVRLKELWNMKVTIIPIVIGALGTVTKGLIQWLEDLEITGRGKIIQSTALLRLARILRRVSETCGDLLSLKLQTLIWKTLKE